MASDQINKMLASQNKDLEKADGVLARLFRRMLADLHINHYEWNAKMERYLDNPRNRVPNNSKDRSSARGNLNKELYRPMMTWKVFDKALRFLGPLKVRFEVHLYWSNKRTTIHGINIRLSDTDLPGEDQDDTPSTDET